MPSLPYIFLAFANNTDQQYLPALLKERDDIRLTLLDLTLWQRAFFTDWYDFESEHLFHVINKTRSMLQVFHFGGHAGSSFGSSRDEAAIVLADRNEQGKNLVNNYLKHCPDLKLIFLNGCSTHGFVRLIREEAGIGAAIIVTTRPIGDKTSAVFAKRFYEALSEEGCQLEAAFNLAAGQFPEQQFEVVRDLESEVEEEWAEAQEFPWTLYVDGTVTGDWVLVPQQEKPVELDPEIAKLRTRIKQQQETMLEVVHSLEELPKLEDKILELDQALQQQGISPAIQAILEASRKETQAKLDEIGSKATIQTAVDQAQLTIQGLLKSIEEKALVQHKMRTGEKLRHRLKELNFFRQMTAYEEEKDHFAAAPSKLPARVFIIYGTRFCGHEILLERCKHKSLLDAQNAEFIYLDQNAKSNESIDSAADLWKSIYMGLTKSDQPAAPAAAEEVMRLLSQKNQGGSHCVLVYRCSTKLTDSRLDILKTFWEELHQLAEQGEVFKFNASYKIYFFLLDKSSPVIIEDGESARQAYEQRLANKNWLGPTVHLLPPIPPVDQQTLDAWMIGFDLPKTPKFAEAEYNLPVLHTLETACDKLGEPDIFEELIRELQPRLSPGERPSISWEDFQNKNLNPPL